MTMENAVVQSKENERKEALGYFIHNLGLEYRAEFVPQSKSRNAKEKHHSINWIIILSKGNAKLTTDYMQGIGHIPNYHKIIGWNARRTWAVEGFERMAAEQGRAARSLDSSALSKPLPNPDLADILYSLISDASVLDAGGFESWAADLGYDADSRKAESIYNACLEIALKLRALIGDKAISKLQTLFQDY